MNEVDSMCKNVEYLADKLQAVRACQGYQSQVCDMDTGNENNNIIFNLGIDIWHKIALK